MKLNLMAIWEEVKKTQQADPDKTKEYQFAPLPAEQPQIDPESEYEEEGYLAPRESQGELPWQTPTQHGDWQKSLVPQSPQAPQEIEDFSQQMEQDSPAPQGRTGPLRPQPQMRPVGTPGVAPWTNKDVRQLNNPGIPNPPKASNTQMPAQTQQMPNPPPPAQKRKPMRIPVR